MFFKVNIMFLLLRIMLPRLELFGCGAIFVIYEKAYTKMAPQGALLPLSLTKVNLLRDSDALRRH